MTQLAVPELVFLGTGTSAGVPMIACDGDPPCACFSGDPRDDRDRASILLRVPVRTEFGGDGSPSDTARDGGMHRNVVVDTGPEFRRQCLREKLMHLDAVLYTHAHADHILGLDDLRRFNAAMDSAIDVYTEATVLESFHRVFTYIFEPHRNINKSFIATLIAHEVQPGEAFTLPGLPDLDITPLRLMHGRLPILGFRFDLQVPTADGPSKAVSMAYCTDVSTIPPETYPLLESLDVFVIDGLRYKHHPTHLTIDQACEVISQIAPRRAYLTHVAHDVIYAELEPRLPDGVTLAYDGLRVPLMP